MNFKKLLEILKKGGGKNKQINNIIIVILIGILLIISAGFFKDNKATSTFSNSPNSGNSTANSQSSNDLSTTEDISAYENEQENKLKALLQSIQGVGDTRVMIYFSTGEEDVPAYNENKSSSVINETDNSGGKRTTTQNNSGTSIVMENDGEKTKPFILKKYKPKVTGILISAEGADDSDIRLNITNAVSSFFDLSADKVNVYPMKK
ncbi:stage III sporulation protein AG [Clostridium pasteurianum DSM 525 = ATCC 6013]|uniref:Stage III sporulation protein AG n=1 Tax=Clostridium pasteurianum DSM 525 = ATCC 6013 TaxID=1262449 RepID=A0A0H3J7T7_CLOPA|nr:stage III sporulation protein AG [Clostridium pasteurianum]AJA47973.1 stage III sporulation protein AG [Clostridium pasteurianum DSM 525 = ATCC 6013]AJA51961.1 stage III sporulation protein AG [Clostridium pasteurianum DSM 525 = ATCC 6013]AOZ75258.1 stage III sporulation protein AG [Clostridium pasteurianum DSM 525 = ATCC 6013]AOZ79053.1 stage III sporulation protein AG [Clostridium pasteurianum]ELP59876.1 stage III sporulation protein AG [Clostridium pasteurianum DSM 525 = ATCC 6013]